MAQMDAIGKGADHGLAGYILMVIALFVAVGVPAWFKYVALPGMEASRKAAEQDQANKGELTKAVAALCTVMGEAHTRITETASNTGQVLDQTSALLSVARLVLPALRKLASECGVDLTDELARMEGVLDRYGDGSRLHRPLPPGAK